MVYDETKSAGDLIDSADWNTMIGSFKKTTIFSSKFGAEDTSETGSKTAWTTVADSDIAVDPTIFKIHGNLWLRFMAHIKQSNAGSTTYIQLYRQNAGTAVAGTTGSVTGVDWKTWDTNWLDWSSESAGGGSESYQVQIKVNGGTGEYNSAIMLLAAGSY